MESDHCASNAFNGPQRTTGCTDVVHAADLKMSHIEPLEGSNGSAVFCGFDCMLVVLTV